MAQKRKADDFEKTWYRSERFSEHCGQWYFLTREGTNEGPFSSRRDAARRLDTYIGIRRSGFLSEEAELELELLPPH